MFAAQRAPLREETWILTHLKTMNLLRELVASHNQDHRQAHRPFSLSGFKTEQKQIVLSERINKAVDSDVVDSKDILPLCLVLLKDHPKREARN
jgi:hypothetical protein